MLTTVQCPICQTATRIPATASVATCPNCLRTFSPPPGETAPRHHAPLPDREDQEGPASEGGWINPFGAVAVTLATLATLSASVVGVRMVTIVMVLLGLLVVAVGLVVGKGERQSKDPMWFALGIALNGLVLFIVLFYPGWLNSFWGLDIEPNEPGLHQLVVVPRKQPYATGKLLNVNDWVEAPNDAIRQGKVLVRIEAVRTGSRGGTACLQVHLQIVNLSSEVLSIAGFGTDNHTPVLTDSAGRSYAFLRPQKRIPRDGPPVFEDIVDQGVELRPDGWQDYLLLFVMPTRTDGLKLEVPTSAWGRDGRCKFNLTDFFRGQ